MLEVVQEKQQTFVADRRSERVLGADGLERRPPPRVESSSEGGTHQTPCSWTSAVAPAA